MLQQENATSTNGQREILVCHGSEQVLIRLEEEIIRLGLDVKVKFTGCHGFCQVGPTSIVEPDDIFYCYLSVDDVPEIVRGHLKDNKVEDR